MGAITLLLLLTPLSGCFGAQDPPKETGEDQYPSIWDRHTLEWNTSHTHTFVLEPGPHYAPRCPRSEYRSRHHRCLGGGPNSATVHLSYWLPSNTLEGEKVPVISVISPYFSYGSPGDESSPTNVVGGGRGEFIYDNYIPHGYAFAQVAVFATEESTGCFDYRGDGEGLSIHTAVEWLGQQNWSNGNVAIYGKSYEGATAWGGRSSRQHSPQNHRYLFLEPLR
ncbi:MAG: hypothetical protein Ct9H90mP16_15000 [Candidatus Poseidoniales archaeon]|nr:MAG: hypothetical protein Ct9H90mP16_15000 [Candidatus Poseidoniales archaeon]